VSPLTIGPETERRIAGELWDGETVLWSGRPTGTRLAARRLGSALAALALTAFVAYVLYAGDNPILAVTAAVTGVFVVARFALAHWIGVGTVYVVTNRRVMTVGLGSDVSVKWMSGRELKNVTFNARPDGSGNLVFERHLSKVEQRAEDERSGLFKGGGSIRGPADLEHVLDNPTAETFVGVPDVEAVFELVRRTFAPPAP